MLCNLKILQQCLGSYEKLLNNSSSTVIIEKFLVI